MARQGMAGFGKARQGREIKTRLGTVRRGGARLGLAGRGEAGKFLVGVR